MPILKTISQFCGLPLLHTLPQELLEIIRHHSQHSLLWRCIPVLRPAASISATASEPLFTLPLRDIDSWERSGVLQRVVTSHSPLPVLRLTVDSGGISKVERLRDRLQYVGERTRRSAFLIIQDEETSEVAAQLKVRSPPKLRFINTHGANYRCLSCRTDACVLWSHANHPSNCGILPRHPASLSAQPTLLTTLAAKLCMPLKWTIFGVLPSSSPAAVCLVFMSTNMANLALWTLMLGLFRTDAGEALSGLIYLFHGQIGPFFWGFESSSNPGPSLS